jgi:hypothetical protein
MPSISILSRLERARVTAVKSRSDRRRPWRFRGSARLPHEPHQLVPRAFHEQATMVEDGGGGREQQRIVHEQDDKTTAGPLRESGGISNGVPGVIGKVNGTQNRLERHGSCGLRHRVTRSYEYTAANSRSPKLLLSAPFTARAGILRR